MINKIFALPVIEQLTLSFPVVSLMTGSDRR